MPRGMVAALAVLAAAPAQARGGEPPEPPEAAQTTQAQARGAPVARAEEPARLPHERYRLPNGLEVILAPQSGARMVAVDVWYHVGSDRDPSGREGLAHLTEHLMFNGSEHVPFSHSYLVHRYGGEGANAYTTLDRTAYFQTMPSFNLETALWLESDRMGFLDADADQAVLALTRKVIRSELRLRARGERLSEALLARLFPPTHPYGSPIGGTPESLERVAEQDVESFRARWYAPSNATLALVGDFDPAEAHRLVQRYFGDLPTVPAPTAPVPAKPVVQAEVHRLEPDDADPPAVAIGWIAPGAFEAGEAELQVLAAILESRLAWRLGMELELAEEAGASLDSYRGVGVFEIRAVGVPEATSDALLAEIERVLDTLSDAGPGEREIERAVLRFHTGQISSLDGLSGLMVRAELLQTYNHYLGRADRFAWDVSRYDDVTPASVQDAMAKWLAPDRRVTVVRDTDRALAARGDDR